ncbi:MAG: hypothetical protein HRT47_11575 [Candidatus Caenarcaniphilales bacterium]|nr:hypothetical protein [Candidatus Caenarcaniphilales bacterium]
MSVDLLLNTIKQANGMPVSQTNNTASPEEIANAAKALIMPEDTGNKQQVSAEQLAAPSQEIQTNSLIPGEFKKEIVARMKDQFVLGQQVTGEKLEKAVSDVLNGTEASVQMTQRFEDPNTLTSNSSFVKNVFDTLESVISGAVKSHPQEVKDSVNQLFKLALSESKLIANAASDSIFKLAEANKFTFYGENKDFNQVQSERGFINQIQDEIVNMSSKPDSLFKLLNLTATQPESDKSNSAFETLSNLEDSNFTKVMENLFQLSPEKTVAVLAKGLDRAIENNDTRPSRFNYKSAQTLKKLNILHTIVEAKVDAAKAKPILDSIKKLLSDSPLYKIADKEPVKAESKVEPEGKSNNEAVLKDLLNNPDVAKVLQAAMKDVQQGKAAE